MKVRTKIPPRISDLKYLYKCVLYLYVCVCFVGYPGSEGEDRGLLAKTLLCTMSICVCALVCVSVLYLFVCVFCRLSGL